MESKAYTTIDKLINDGWSIDHWALFNGYYPSGTITEMQTRNNVKYCRVHKGKCKNVKIGYYPNDYKKCMQETIVMKKPA